jgi:hypothetical protein
MSFLNDSGTLSFFYKPLDKIIACKGKHLICFVCLRKQESNCRVPLQIDQPGSAIDAYISGLRDVLERKASNIAQLQGRLESFQAQLRDEEELSSLIAAKLHMRGGKPPHGFHES